MNRIFHSVRLRLQIWHALILAVVIAALCLLVHRLAADERREQLDRDLDAFERSFVRSVIRKDSGGEKDTGPPSLEDLRHMLNDLTNPADLPLEMRGLFDPAATASTFLAFWDGDGNLIFRSANAPADLQPPASREALAGPSTRIHGKLHELVRRGPGGMRAVVGRDVSSDQAALRNLAWKISASGAALWALGLFGGWWLAGRAIQPVAAISRTASRIAGGNVSERIDIANTADELGQLSHTLNDTFDRLEAAIQHQREFTADASHELRTPLTVILSEISRGLKRERDPAEYREILTTCSHAAGRMRSLVESLLVLARQDGHPQGAPRETIDLAASVAEALELLQPLAARHRITVHADLQPASCHADPQAIPIAATNLVTNAILHQASGGSVRVRVFPSDNQAVLEVEDTGPGIAPEHLPRLFDRFYRTDPARGSDGRHTGLGLAIVRAIAENHHGTITVESSPGSGSTFRLSIPNGDPPLRA